MITLVAAFLGWNLGLNAQVVNTDIPTEDDIEADIEDEDDIDEEEEDE